jgi:hypothetical protein
MPDTNDAAFEALHDFSFILSDWMTCWRIAMDRRRADPRWERAAAAAREATAAQN